MRYVHHNASAQPLQLSSPFHHAWGLVLTSYSQRNSVARVLGVVIRNHTVKNRGRGMPYDIGNLVLAAFAMGELCGMHENWCRI